MCSSRTGKLSASDPRKYWLRIKSRLCSKLTRPLLLSLPPRPPRPHDTRMPMRQTLQEPRRGPQPKPLAECARTTKAASLIRTRRLKRNQVDDPSLQARRTRNLNPSMCRGESGWGWGLLRKVAAFPLERILFRAQRKLYRWVDSSWIQGLLLRKGIRLECLELAGARNAYSQVSAS